MGEEGERGLGNDEGERDMAMTSGTMSGRGRILVVIAAVSLLASPTIVGAQRVAKPVDLPDGPAIAGFDIERFSNAGTGWFETFHVDQTEPLSTALRDRRLAGDTLMLVIDTAAGPLAFVRDQMAFDHIAQGRAGGKDWMATF